MNRILLLLVGLLGGAGAQVTAPGITVTPTTLQPAPPELARKVLVQPARLETRLQPGYTTGNLNLTLFSEVNTEVALRASDPRLVFRGSRDGVQRLNAYTAQSVSFVALEAHSGTLTVSNRAGEVLVTVPYMVAPPKTLNQSASLNYSPSSNRGALSYAVSGVAQSPLDPRWSLNVNLNVSTDKGTVGGSIGFNMSW